MSLTSPITNTGSCLASLGAVVSVSISSARSYSNCFSNVVDTGVPIDTLVYVEASEKQSLFLFILSSPLF